MLAMATHFRSFQEGLEGFWITNPANIIHLIAK
jgi:hypothetical protein